MSNTSVEFKQNNLIDVLDLKAGELGLVIEVKENRHQYLMDNVVKRIGGYPDSHTLDMACVVSLTADKFIGNPSRGDLMVRRIPKGSKITIEV